MQIPDKDVIISESEKNSENPKQGLNYREVWGHGTLQLPGEVCGITYIQ